MTAPTRWIIIITPLIINTGASQEERQGKGVHWLIASNDSRRLFPKKWLTGNDSSFYFRVILFIPEVLAEESAERDLSSPNPITRYQLPYQTGKAFGIGKVCRHQFLVIIATRKATENVLRHRQQPRKLLYLRFLRGTAWLSPFIIFQNAKTDGYLHSPLPSLFPGEKEGT